jgi:hypothetical protein
MHAGCDDPFNPLTADYADCLMSLRSVRECLRRCTGLPKARRKQVCLYPRHPRYLRSKCLGHFSRLRLRRAGLCGELPEPSDIWISASPYD